jgi:hypothetical protein
VRALDDKRMAWVRFVEPEHLDSMNVSLGLLQHPVRQPLFAECASPIPGWRTVSSTSAPALPLVAARNGEALVDLRREPPGFLADLVVSPVLALQRQLLFIHAASIGINGSGALLIGPTSTGKTTSALALAARGHALFGDDMAAVRTETCEIIPFRRSANIRPGPHAGRVNELLKERAFEPDPLSGGEPHIRVHVGDLFPGPAAPLKLRDAFFLRGFDEHPRAVQFEPTMENLRSIALNVTLMVSWGLSPQRRLMQFLIFVRLLASLRCHFLTLGRPEDSAELIEQTTEALWD